MAQLSKEFEEKVNEIIEQLLLGTVLMLAMGALGVADQSKVWQSIYESLVASLDTIIQDLVEELKSTDGFSEIIAMFELLKDLGFWLDNVTTWLSSAQTRLNEMESLQDAMDFLKESVEEYHAFMEELDELLSPEQADAVEPNSPEDE